MENENSFAKTADDIKKGDDDKDLSRIGRFSHWIRMNLWGKSADNSRLAGDIEYYIKRLEYLKQENHQSDAQWAHHAEELLGSAKVAFRNDNNDLSWRCLDSARSFLFLGMKKDDLKAEAQAICNEAEDQKKKVSSWRKKTIHDFLYCDCKLKEDPQGKDLFNASTILFENHHNRYNKLWRIKRELVILACVAAITIIILLIIIPPLEEARDIDNRFILSVVLFGVMGASISGILTTARSGADAGIPEQLIGFWVLLAKLVVGAASAFAIFAFLLSDFLSFREPTSAQIMAISFAAGFSERLVTLAVESVTNK